jgi:small subunit ribosomal protein S1
MRRGGERIAASEYIGRRFDFRVTKLEQGGRNIVVSRRTILEAEAASAAEQTWERIHVGAVLDGTVSSVRDFGAFVDLGGVEGMIHVSEFGYSRVAHPGDVLSVGQSVRAQVIKVGETTDSRGRRQVGLSLKALAVDPWTTLKQQFPVGSTVAGTIRRLEAFGAFVEIAPGIEGLVHVSKITTERRLSHPRQVLEVGQAVEVTILAIDSAQRRISLSMVERAKGERDAQERSERAEEQRVMAELNQPKSLGTFADLLDAGEEEVSRTSSNDSVATAEAPAFVNFLANAPRNCKALPVEALARCHDHRESLDNFRGIDIALGFATAVSRARETAA